MNTGILDEQEKLALEDSVRQVIITKGPEVRRASMLDMDLRNMAFDDYFAKMHPESNNRIINYIVKPISCMGFTLYKALQNTCFYPNEKIVQPESSAHNL